MGILVLLPIVLLAALVISLIVGIRKRVLLQVISSWVIVLTFVSSIAGMVYVTKGGDNILPGAILLVISLVALTANIFILVWYTHKESRKKTAS